MKPYGPGGYQTWAEKQAEKQLIHEAMKNYNGERRSERLFAGRPPADPLTVVDDDGNVTTRHWRVGEEATREARLEDARIFLAIGFFVGLGAGFIVGVLLAAR